MSCQSAPGKDNHSVCVQSYRCIPTLRDRIKKINS
ncbi:unnamed protein product, partial [Staurois parvus]